MSGFTDKGRDGCRVPIPWSMSEQSAFGFSHQHPMGIDEAWLPQPPWWGSYSVESQEKSADSSLNLYRKALAIRKQESGLGDGPMEWVELGSEILAFKRPGNFLCIVNFGAPTKLPAGEIIIASGPVDGDLLPADTALWLRTS